MNTKAICLAPQWGNRTMLEAESIISHGSKTDISVKQIYFFSLMSIF
jgi:hypothetical protein